MSREDFEGIKEYAKQQHDERVAKTPDRIRYAIQQFEKNNIEYELKNEQIGHFHCRRKCDDKLFQFYAGTGKIQGENRRGIHNLIKILTKDNPKTQYERIKAMSLEEMAVFLTSGKCFCELETAVDCIHGWNPEPNACVEHAKKWLESEVKE